MWFHLKVSNILLRQELPYWLGIHGNKSKTICHCAQTVRTLNSTRRDSKCAQQRRGQGYWRESQWGQRFTKCVSMILLLQITPKRMATFTSCKDGMGQGLGMGPCKVGPGAQPSSVPYRPTSVRRIMALLLCRMSRGSLHNPSHKSQVPSFSIIFFL